MKKVLFVSSFLSGIHQTKDVAETISEKLVDYGIASKLVSFKKNKFLRLLDIVYNIIVFRGEFIHLHTFSDQAFKLVIIASYIARVKKKKIIFTLHGGKLPKFENENKRRVYRTLSQAYRILTPSLFLKSHFETQNYSVEYLPNPIDLSKFPFKEKTEDKSHKILWVRAFVDFYNPEIAILTLFEVHKKYPNASLTMIGPDRGLLVKCKELIFKLNLQDFVVLTGPISNDLLYSYYQTHDVYLNTTSYESFGLALMEAASCGIPIVSSGVGEIPYLWEDKKTMMISSELNSVEFSYKIIELFSDYSLKTRIIQNARLLAMNYDIEKIGLKWLKILQ